MSRILRVPFFDLRAIKTPEEAREITSVSEVPVVIRPKSPRSAELLAALNGISLTDVSCIVELEDDASINTVNGLCELTADNFRPDRNTLYVINGTCFIHDVPDNARGNIVINGTLVIAANLKDRLDGINLPLVNGRIEYVDAQRMLSFDNKVIISREFLKYVKKGTLIVSGNKIEITPEVTEYDLEKAEVSLFSANKIICQERLIPYLQVKAVYGNKVGE